MIECSVVIPTYRRPCLLERCLGALAQQSMSADRYEIIVADDAADGTTARCVATWRERGLPVRHLPVAGPRHGPAAARNAGGREARGWLVAFTDDDTVPDAEWLRRAHAVFEMRPDLDAAHGRVVVPLPNDPTDYERDAAGLEDAGFVTANCFVRREILEALGGFDECFSEAWREDTDLFFRLLTTGRRVERVSGAVVVHPVRAAKWGVSVRQQRKAAFDALLYKKHPTLFIRYVRPGRPTLYYPAVIALAAVVVGAVTGTVGVLAGGGATWAALTGTIAARRLRNSSHAPRHVAEMVLTSSVIPPLSLFWRVRGALRYRVCFW